MMLPTVIGQFRPEPDGTIPLWVGIPFDAGRGSEFSRVLWHPTDGQVREADDPGELID